MSKLISDARKWKLANPDCPVTVHASGRYCKMVLGELKYFGKITEPIETSARAAWNAWLDQREYLLAGRKVPDKAGDGVVTVKLLCDSFLAAKEQAMVAGNLSPRSFNDYLVVGKRIAKEFGKTRAVADLGTKDFADLLAALSKTLGPVSVGNWVQRVRTFFKWGLEAGLLATPMRFGPDFKKPSAKVLRKARREAGIKMFEAVEIKKLLDEAGVTMKAMILLAANAAYGNHDVASLPISAIDLDRGWIDFARPKTEISRRCPLWPETIQAIKAAMAVRPEPKDPAHSGLAFVTKYGQSWGKDFAGGPLGQEFSKLVKYCGLARPGRGFYSLRHGWRTIADATRDFPAIDLIMGHVDDSMGGRYRERVDDARLVAVSDAVRLWLFPEAKAKPAKQAKAKAKPAAPPKARRAKPAGDVPRILKFATV
jgi:integrase